MDAKIAFLAYLGRGMPMEHSQGFVQKGKEHSVCKWKKAPYGLNQAHRTDAIEVVHQIQT